MVMRIQRKTPYVLAATFVLLFATAYIQWTAGGLPVLPSSLSTAPLKRRLGCLGFTNPQLRDALGRMRAYARSRLCSSCFTC
jgi:hypothetical protein